MNFAWRNRAIQLWRDNAVQNITRTLVAAAMLATAAAGNATVLFSDNFDTAIDVLNVGSLPGWTITGAVDLVQQANGFGIGTCVSGCLDLDGSPGPGMILSNSIAFAAGIPVTVSFDISGNQRGGSGDVFTASTLFTPANGGIAGVLSGPVSFTNTALFDMLNMVTPYSETISSGRASLTYSYTFTANTAGSFQLGFATLSADSIGPILDNVLVTQVPEPATWAMLITGFGMVGFAARRRRIAVAA